MEAPGSADLASPWDVPREFSLLLPDQDPSRRQRASARVAVAPCRGDRWLARSERCAGTGSQVSRMRGGVYGPRDRHRDLFANCHVPAGDACDIVRGVIGFRCCKTSAEFSRAGSHPAVILRVSMTTLTKGDDHEAHAQSRCRSPVPAMVQAHDRKRDGINPRPGKHPAVLATLSVSSHTRRRPTPSRQNKTLRL